MTNQPPNPNPPERYAMRMRALAESDPEIRARVPDPSVQQATLRAGLSSAQIVSTVLDGYAARAALGERRYEIAAGQRRYLPAFDTITYDELRARVEALACAWRRHERHRVAADEF